VWLLSVKQGDPLWLVEIKGIWSTASDPDWADASAKEILSLRNTLNAIMMESAGGQTQLRKKRLVEDPLAESSDPNRPPFIAPPPGSKPYHGFYLVPEITFDGFTYGAITDFLEPDAEQGCTYGDGFVEGPDGTRAGIVWEVSDQLTHSTIQEPDENRWGVYHITVPKAVNSFDDMRGNFALMLPILKEHYQQTRRSPS